MYDFNFFINSLLIIILNLRLALEDFRMGTQNLYIVCNFYFLYIATVKSLKADPRSPLVVNSVCLAIYKAQEQQSHVRVRAAVWS